MARVDRTGTFKAVPTDWGISKSRGGFPTFNVKARLVEFYDGESGEWVNWDQFGVDETVFLCLVGVDKKTKQQTLTANHTQVMKVFGWDGESLVKLSEGDYSELVFQVRYKDNDPEYADKNPFTASWIDVEDADPVSGLQKLDAEDLNALNTDFSMLAKKAGKGKKAAAKAPAKKTTKPKAPPKSQAAKNAAVNPPREPDVEESVADNPEEKKQKLLEKSKKNLADRKPTVAAPPPRTSPPDATGIKGDKCSKQEAWGTIVELKNDDVSDETLGKVWNGAIDEIAGDGVDNKDVTPEQWFKIMHATLDQVGKF